MTRDLEWADRFEDYARQLAQDSDLDPVLRSSAVARCEQIYQELRGCASYKLGYRVAMSTPNIVSVPQAVEAPYLLGEVQRGWRDAKAVMKMRN